jgi:hypothetical protein
MSFPHCSSFSGQVQSVTGHLDPLVVVRCALDVVDLDRLGANFQKSSVLPVSTVFHIYQASFPICTPSISAIFADAGATDGADGTCIVVHWATVLLKS